MALETYLHLSELDPPHLSNGENSVLPVIMVLKNGGSKWLAEEAGEDNSKHFLRGYYAL